MVRFVHILVVFNLLLGVCHAAPQKTLAEQATALKRDVAWKKSILNHDFMLIGDLAEKAKLANDFAAIDILRGVFVNALSDASVRAWAMAYLKELLFYNASQYQRILSSSSIKFALEPGLFEPQSQKMLDEVLLKLRPLLASDQRVESGPAKVLFQAAFQQNIYTLLIWPGTRSSQQLRSYIQNQKWILEELKAVSAQAEIDFMMRQMMNMLSGTPYDYAASRSKNFFRDAYAREIAAITLIECFDFASNESSEEINQVLNREMKWQQNILKNAFRHSRMTKDLYRQIERATNAFELARVKYGCEFKLTR